MEAKNRSITSSARHLYLAEYRSKGKNIGLFQPRHFVDAKVKILPTDNALTSN